jgi:hypothetical protein
MKVYVLTALLINDVGTKKATVNIETYVFKDEKRCLLNIGANQVRLEEAYNKVRMYCTPSEIIDKENK